MGDALSECVQAALVATVAQLDTSKLAKVKIVVERPRGVPAGRITVVAHARAPQSELHEKICAATGGKAAGEKPSQRSGGRSSSLRSSADAGRQQQRRETRQQQSREEESNPPQSRRARRWLKLQRKWRARRLVAFAQIFYSGILRRFARRAHEQRLVAMRRLASMPAMVAMRAAKEMAAAPAAAAPSAAVDGAVPQAPHGCSELGLRPRDEEAAGSAAAVGKRRARPSRAARLTSSPEAQVFYAAIRRANPDWDQAAVAKAVSTILATDDAAAQQEILLAITASDEEWAADRAARGGGASSSGGA